MEKLTEMEANWSLRMAEFDKRLEAASVSSSPSLVQLAEDFHSFKEIVRNMLNLMQQQLRDCVKVTDSLDMRQRQKIILFNGIAEDPEIEVQDKVLDIIHNKLGIPHISGDSLKRCHRLGPQGNDRPRTVLVHFREHCDKVEVWKSKSKLKGAAVSMAEFLTRLRHSVHLKARDHFGFRNVWTLDGVINIKVASDKRVKVVTEEELNDLISKFPKVKSSEETGASLPGQANTSTKHDVLKPAVGPIQADDLKRSRRMKK